MEAATVLTAIIPTGYISETNTSRRRVGVEGQLLPRRYTNLLLLHSLRLNPFVSLLEAQSLRAACADKAHSCDKG